MPTTTLTITGMQSDDCLRTVMNAIQDLPCIGYVDISTATGEATDPAEVSAVRDATRLPVLVGSGVSLSNLADYAEADALIVGSSVKQHGLWSNPLDGARIAALVRAFRTLPPKAAR